jgi:hypothetical protein
VTAYKAYGDVGKIDFYPGNSTGVCFANIHNNDTVVDHIRSLLAIFKAAVLDDFAPGRQRISPLPNLLYPCSARARIMAPWTQIVLDCLTAAAAIFSPLFAAVIWALQRVPPDLEAQAEGAPNVTWEHQRGEAELIRDRDAQPEASFLLPPTDSVLELQD